MFEATFKNLDNALRKDDGCSTEMDYIDKLSPALISKYGGVYEAQQELGNVDDIKKVFVDFQQYLYDEKVA